MKRISLLSIVSLITISVYSSICPAQDLTATRPRRVKPAFQHPSDQIDTELAVRAKDNMAETDLAVAAPWVRLSKKTPSKSSQPSTPIAANITGQPAADKPDVPIIDNFYCSSSEDKTGAKHTHIRVEGRATAGATVQFFFDDSNKATFDNEAPVSSNGTFLLLVENRSAERVWVRAKVGDKFSDLSSVSESYDPTKPFLVGLAPFGLVMSQQSEQFSQSDPFGGFIVGNVRPVGLLKEHLGRSRSSINLRFQVLMQPEARTAMATPASSTATPPSTPSTSTPSTTFLSSRKSLDIEGHMWWEIALNRVLSIGPYAAIGGATVLNKNELVGEDVSTGQGGSRTQLDTTTNLITTNDMKKYYEYGMLMDFYSGRSGDANLYIQAILAKGWYEALANLDGTGHDTRKRFIGKLRIFPFGLSRNFLARGTVAPMFGVDLNAGRGQDQLRLFVGMMFNITQFLNKAKEALP